MKKLLFFLLFALSLQISAKEGNITHTYGTKQGLPSNKVSCVIQDRDGFLWFGTDNGVCRFDGRKNQTFSASNHNLYHIGDNNIYTLMEDSSGNIWAGTKNGAFVCKDGLNFEVFNQKTRYGVTPSCEVTCIFQTSSGDIFFGTLGQGLFIYSPQSGVLRQDNIHVTFISGICSIENAVYLASMGEGIAHYTISGSFVDYVNSQNGTRFTENVCSFALSENTVWMGTLDCKLYNMDSHGRLLKSVDLSNSGFKTIKSLFIEPNLQDLLIGTDRGLFRVSKNDVRKESVICENDKAFLDAEVKQICWDTEGGLWFATSNLGVIYLSHRHEPFQTIRDDKLRMINAFCEDEESGRIWMAGRKGLFYKYPSSNQIRQFLLNGGKAEDEDEIKALCLSGQELWIGTNGQGLKVLNLRTGAVKSYLRESRQPNSLCDNFITSICKRKNGDICIGTRWGYCYFRPQMNSFYTFTSLSFTINVTDIKEDDNSNLWISTSNSGMYVLYDKDFDFTHYEGDDPINKSYPPSTNVICIYPGKNGRVWFGTYGKGLFFFDNDKREFGVFKSGDRWLTSRIIYSMQYDYNGYLCLATDAGFVHLPESENINYQVMTSEDGLAGDQFNNGASLSSRDGLLYYGETGGVDVLDLTSFDNNKFVPAVYISGIRLNDAENDEKAVLDLELEKTVHKLTKMALPYYHNNLTFSFSSLSFQDPRKNRFSYKLDGFDANWISDVENNEAVYKNLKPGKYVLRLKASNNDNIWNEDGDNLYLTITPPWWRSKVAFVIYVLLLIGAVITLIFYYRRHSKNKYLKLIENFNATKEKEIYRSKIQFFTQIVHEIRTPLTLIKLPVETLKERLGPSDKDCQTIDRNLNYLLGVVNELLDMQKIENGEIQLQMVRTDLVGLTRDCCDNFDAAFASKGIMMSVHMPGRLEEVLVDPVKISKIVVNILGNALKFAKSKVDVSIFERSSEVVLRIDDDGTGIKKENWEKVFKAFFQEKTDKASLGTGIGLMYARKIAQCHKGDLKVVESCLGGASFELSIPQSPSFEPLPHLVRRETLGRVTPAPSSNETNTVLVVEDNEELLDTIASQLGKWYHVHKADNGRSAISILERFSVDVIVSDVMMPVMDGLELCQMVKNDINYSHIPVILLTAKIQLQAKVEGLEAGADVYMEKPFTIEQLRMQIENLFRLRTSFHEWLANLLSSPEAVVRDIEDNNNVLPESGCKFIIRMNEVINQHLSQEDFSLEDFSKELGMSKSSFYRKLHDLSNMTPNEYLKNYRLGCASEMLLKGMRVSEVFSEVGFSTSSYFTKCFKQKYGVLPKDFQRKR